MTVISLGTVLRGSIPAFSAELNRGLVFVWRELPNGPEAVVWKRSTAMPMGWSGGLYPWKAIGDYSELVELWKTQRPPAGSRSVCIKGGAVLQVDLPNSTLRVKGQRLKKVLIVDDSPTIRKLLRHVIEQFGDWDIVGELSKAEGLDSALEELLPDVVTLDLNLEGMNGAEAMRRFLAPGRVPTILISSQPKEDGGLVMEALAAGAMDYMQKPESGRLDELSFELKQKFEAALKFRWQVQSSGLSSWKELGHSFASLDCLIAIGSSTGGTQALQDILLSMPRNIPPVLITQHIPALFSRALAERFNSLCPFEVREASNGDEIKPNRVLIAPGGHHMELARGGRIVRITDEEPVNRFRPSVDVLFDSIARNTRLPVVASILTGMGKDGAQGLLTLKNAGHQTIAQDEKSSVVFGMPKAAIELGAAMRVEPLQKMVSVYIESVEKIQNRLSKTV